MTPLVDVLLLVIFMIAAPVMSKAIPDTMPQRAPFDPPMTVLEPATLRIDAAGSLSIEGAPSQVDDLGAALQDRAGEQASRRPPRWIDADDDSQYEASARVLAAANDAGLQVGFVRRKAPG